MLNLKHPFNLSLFLFAVWLLLSGHYTPLLLTLGVLSTLLVVFIAARAELIDHEMQVVLIKPRVLLYWLWLGGEIIKANIDVCRRILDPRLPISPRMIRVQAMQQTELGRVTYANSITLVPGTVTVSVEGDRFTVHALTREAADDLEGGELNRRVQDVEQRF
jgi:multicomponent Na+:H+ antiporter subunit E